MLQLLLGVFSGSITPVQTAVNARLGRSVGSPLRASMVSFSVGLLSMLAIVLATGPYPLLSATAADGPWWMWLAGVFGVTFLTGNVLLLPKLGSLRTVIMPVTGQIVMGLLIDAFGWFGAQQRAISPLRVCGTVLAMAGFLLAVMGVGLQLGHRDAADDAGVRRHVDPGASHDVFAMALWSLAGVSFGMCSAVQTALLGRLGVSLGSPAKASLASFVVGLAALTVVVGLVDHTYSLGDALEKGNPWWMWVGGLLGATLVMCNAYLSSEIGTGMTVMLILLGQVGGGLVVDRFGLLGVPRKHVRATQYVGVILAAMGIVLKAL